jgi:hypothetical protein
VLLSYFGPKVIDFGIARALDASAASTATGKLMGSPGWMAPEQFGPGPVTAAVDIFVWGSLVAYAGTGRRPFGQGTVVEVVYRIRHEAPDLGGLEGRLRALVERCMDKEPERRPSARTLLLELLGDHADPDPRPPPPSCSSGAGRPHRPPLDPAALTRALVRQGFQSGCTRTWSRPGGPVTATLFQFAERDGALAMRGQLRDALGSGGVRPARLPQVTGGELYLLERGGGSGQLVMFVCNERVLQVHLDAPGPDPDPLLVRLGQSANHRLHDRTGCPL